MKRIVYGYLENFSKVAMTAFLLIVSTNIYADSWDNLTHNEAEKVQSYLESNPFILDYCDCCLDGYEGQAKVHMLKVISTEIVRCGWDEKAYTVKAKAKKLAMLPYTYNGLDYAHPMELSGEEEVYISMNYTWGFNAKKGQVLPLFSVVDYSYCNSSRECKEDSGLCNAATFFPDPDKNPTIISDQEYKTWFSQNGLTGGIKIIQKDEAQEKRELLEKSSCNCCNLPSFVKEGKQINIEAAAGSYSGKIIEIDNCWVQIEQNGSKKVSWYNFNVLIKIEEN